MLKHDKVNDHKPQSRKAGAYDRFCLVDCVLSLDKESS